MFANEEEETNLQRRIPNNLCSCLSLRRQRKTHSLSLNCSSDFHPKGMERERERKKKRVVFIGEPENTTSVP